MQEADQKTVKTLGHFIPHNKFLSENKTDLKFKQQIKYLMNKYIFFAIVPAKESLFNYINQVNCKHLIKNDLDRL